MEPFIVCGSKRYKNLNIDFIVDAFNNIVRHNFLLHNYGYGKKSSRYQILNGHMYKTFYKDKESIEFCLKKYKDYGVNKSNIRALKEFIENKNITHNCEFLTFHNNNNDLLKKITKISSGSKARCGLSFLPELINNNIKPYLIGYTLKQKEYFDLTNHQINSKRIKPINERMHSVSYDIASIVKLHEMGLIDASFCCIQDKRIIVEALKNNLKDITYAIDESIIKMTKESLELLSYLTRKNLSFI